MVVCDAVMYSREHHHKASRLQGQGFYLCGAIMSIAAAADATIDWSPEQETALRRVAEWRRKRDKQIFRLQGFAGTGKSTLAIEIGAWSARTAFATFTGKAAIRLIERGAPIEQTSTIHRLIYHFNRINRRRYLVTLKKPHELAHIDLIIIDEASMVGNRLARDLLSFGKPILGIGDGFQLPPVKDVGAPFMGQPDVLMTQVHRTALHSPILQVATALREGKLWKRYIDGDAVNYVDYLNRGEAAKHDVVIAGTNNRRRLINQRLRQHFGFDGVLPNVGETLCCLHNDYTCCCFNGETWRVEQVDPLPSVPAVALELSTIMGEPRTAEVIVPNSFFITGDPPADGEIPFDDYQAFDFGYCLTCHKSQGWEWPSVAVIDETHVPVLKSVAARWLYTACTRAAAKLTIVDRSVR